MSTSSNSETILAETTPKVNIKLHNPDDWGSLYSSAVALARNIDRIGPWAVDFWEISDAGNGRFSCHCAEFKNKEFKPPGTGSCQHTIAWEQQREELEAVWGSE